MRWILLTAMLVGLVYLWARRRWARRVFEAWESRIQRVGGNRCARCKCEITPENDSGWWAFVGPHTVQLVCKDCDAKDRMIGAKAPE